jgi:hypothetical protein
MRTIDMAENDQLADNGKAVDPAFSHAHQTVLRETARLAHQTGNAIDQSPTARFITPSPRSVTIPAISSRNQ